MEVYEIGSEEVVGGNSRWARLHLEVEIPEGFFATYLSNEFIEKRADGLEKNFFKVPVFWADPEREKSMDLLWSNYPESVKFKVTTGDRKDHVGYVRPVKHR